MDFYLIFLGFIFSSAIMALGWIVQGYRKDAGIVDVLWAVCLACLGLLYSLYGSAPLERRILIGFVALAWSLRLAFHILFDRVIGKEEDGRYQNLRAHWANRANFNFFFFFQAQAIAALFFSIPFFLVANNQRENFSIFEFVAVVVWLIAFTGEWIADNQLKSFRSVSSNRKKTCRKGLWNYSRHPNYFFEWLHWCSYPLMLIGTSSFLLSLTAPLVMIYSLFKLTGIPHTEAQALKSRGDDYRRYQETTSIFIPWFPKE